MKALGLMIVLLLLQTGCNDAKINGSYSLITEKEALKIAQSHVQDRNAIWSASYKEDEEIKKNNVKEKHKAWIIEAKFPAGNKEIYRIDATDGMVLTLSEMEASW
jgi:predicted amino acid dehydrogenase